MLRQLDPRRLDALSREGNSDEELDFDPSDHIGLIRELITEDDDWSTGVLMLLQDWPGVFKVVKYRKAPLKSWDDRGPDDWSILFQDYPFRDLSLRPSPGGVVDIYAFEKRVQSFQIIGCRRNWPAMIEWIWHYGNKIAMLKPKQKVSKSHAKSHGQRRRVEKPLLHRVLHTAKFKAQNGTTSKVADVAVAPKDTDVEMANVNATGPPYHTTSDMAKSSGRVDLAVPTTGTNDANRNPDTTIEDIDIGALDVVDRNSGEG